MSLYQYLDEDQNVLTDKKNSAKSPSPSWSLKFFVVSRLVVMLRAVVKVDVMVRAMDNIKVRLEK